MLYRTLIQFAGGLALTVPAIATHAAAPHAVPAHSAPAPAHCDDDLLGGQGPSGTAGGRLFCHSFYVLAYSTTLRDPLWTSYHLTRAMAQGGDVVGRYQGSFVHQPGLSAAEQGDHHDYVNPPYDRGHMTPANDAIDMAHERDTFVISNVVPQTSILNEGTWRLLEASVHEIAERDGEVWIVTGPVFSAHPPLMHRPNQAGRIAVPDATFKAIYVPSAHAALGFIATNDAHPVCTIMSVAELAQRTGVDPFPSLPAAVKAAIPVAFQLPTGFNVVRGHRQPLPMSDCH